MSEDVIDEYDRMAELFRTRTGLLCPGKDYPPGMDDGATEDHRGDVWSVFRDYFYEAQNRMLVEKRNRELLAVVEAARGMRETLREHSYCKRTNAVAAFDEAIAKMEVP